MTTLSPENEVSALAHQLLSPVTAAGNYAAAMATALKAGTLTPEKTADGLQRILRETERAQKTAAERSAQAAGLRGQLGAVREALAQSCQALTPPLDPDTLADTLPALRAAAAQDAEAIKAQYTAQQQALAALQALESGLPAQEAALRQQQADMQDRAQEISALEARCAELDADVLRRAQELPHADRAAAQRALDRYARAFDGQLINLQAVLDPEVFVIAGGISCHPELVDALRAQMPLALASYEGTLAGIPVPQIKVAELGNDANLYGAVQEAMRLV